MRTAASFLLLGLLCGCGNTRNRVVGSYPDGSIAQEIDCRQDHPEKCQQRAQQLCHPFGREPRVLEPLVFEPVHNRWRMLVTCGPTNAVGYAPAPMAAPGPRYPSAGPPPAGGFVPVATPPPSADPPP